GFSAKVYSQCTKTLGSASNIISIFSNRPNQIVVDNDLNTVIFIHRNDASIFGGISGYLRYDISTDNGNTWAVNQGVLNPNAVQGTNAGRYPQVGLYNPPGNPSIANAKLIYYAPTTDNPGPD